MLTNEYLQKAEVMVREMITHPSKLLRNIIFYLCLTVL